MQEKTNVELNEDTRKRKLVRNEFLYYGNSSGKFELPIIRKQAVDIDKIKFISYVDTKKGDKDNSLKTVHFFTYDWKFERVYDDAETEIEKLSEFYCVLTPDFSLFTNMPLALQIASVFKNRWCGAYWQSKGLKVIPTVSWGDERSFGFCFDGIEQGSVVAVSTYCRENCKEEFMAGYNVMLEKIKPRAIICYDEPFPEMRGNVVEFLPTTYEWTKELSPADLLHFQWEKTHRNIIGLNPNDFRYFKYDDPHAKVNVTTCDVCGRPLATDAYGNGECLNCGWVQDEIHRENPDIVFYPDLVSLNKAKSLYKQGKPFKPDFEDFVEALFMYSEMTFKYKDVLYEVFLRQDDAIVFCSATMQREFKSKREFIDEANIDNALLKDIWPDVIDADYMN